MSLVSDYKAGSGAVLVETREEARQLQALLVDLDALGLEEEVEVRTFAVPQAPLYDARTGIAEGYKPNTPPPMFRLADAYQWAQAKPGRVLVVYDFHCLVNNAGMWRALIEALPGLRMPKGYQDGDFASLVAFVGPSFELTTANPLRGSIPVRRFALPDRETIKGVAAKLQTLNGEEEQVVDALCGLSADAAQQAAAEVLARTGGEWDVDALREAGNDAFREAGLDIWQPVSREEVGGLGNLWDFVDGELVPFQRDDQLAVRRILCCGTPGTGKSYWPRALARQLNCRIARADFSRIKGKHVGDTEKGFASLLSTVAAFTRQATGIVVLDELDCITARESGDPTAAPMHAMLLTWLEESRLSTKCIVVATLNQLDHLDAAIESRFEARFFFDLPSLKEREAVAKIHYQRLRCEGVDKAAQTTAELTEGFSSREIAQQVVPSVARLSRRQPTKEVIQRVRQGLTPSSETQKDQLEKMRNAAKTLRPANDSAEVKVSVKPTGRAIGKASQN